MSSLVEMNQKVLIICYVIGLFVALTLLFPSNSLAAKPHFSDTPQIVKNSDRSITVNYEAEEIGKKSANVTLSSHTTALIGCVNPGGKLSPSKGSIVEDMQIQSEKLKPKNGEIQGSLTLVPPMMPSGSDICPNKNWSTGILSHTYENVALEIKQRNSEILKLNLGNLSLQ
jgi:hypothetical protein